MSIEIELFDSKTSKDPVDSWEQLLHPEEKSVWESFKIQKRRDDWMAGRIAAKRLMQRRLADGGAWFSLQDIQIQNHPSGEPFVSLPDPYPGPEHYPISISHSNGFAACALGRRDARIGVDIELIEPRSRAWLGVLAHESEISPALESDPTLQTLLWTLKEAVMKVLGTGATVDFWDIRFPSLTQFAKRSPDGKEWGLSKSFDAAMPELHGKALEVWQKIGSPRIAHQTNFLSPDRLILSVAYTTPGGIIHGN